MNKLILSILLILTQLFVCEVQAKINNNYDQNLAQYGQPIEVKEFASKLGFTGYVTYSVDKSWRIKAFFSANKCRLEHLIPQPGENSVLNRDQAKNWAMKMYELKDRGSYIKQVNMPKAVGHFYQRGLLVYESAIKGKSNVGIKGVKVSLYEAGQSYSKSINPRAYL